MVTGGFGIAGRTSNTKGWLLGVPVCVLADVATLQVDSQLLLLMRHWAWSFQTFLRLLELTALEAGKATLSDTSRIASRALPSRKDSLCFVPWALGISAVLET